MFDIVLSFDNFSSFDDFSSFGDFSSFDDFSSSDDSPSLEDFLFLFLLKTSLSNIGVFSSFGDFSSFDDLHKGFTVTVLPIIGFLLGLSCWKKSNLEHCTLLCPKKSIL